MKREGFEPSKAMPVDLQSTPFDHLGISPNKKKLMIGFEPTTR